MVQTLYGGKWLHYAVLVLAMFAIAAALMLNFRSLLGANSPWLSGVSVAVGLLVGVLGYSGRVPLRVPLRALRSGVQVLPMISLLVVGLVLRMAWIGLFPAEPGSDAKVYVYLASRLAAGLTYEVADTLAYWPIGYPAWLSIWFRLLGSGREVWLSSNLVLYLIAAVGVYRVASALAGNTAGKLALLLFAIWPNLVAMTATPEKEILITALLPWALYGMLNIFKGGRVTWRILASGFLFGFCILVQPSLQLLPFALGLLLIVIDLKRGFGRGFAAAALLMLGIALAVGPWTLRNYATFDRFVLVSTNGGDNFYRANNPLATGGYTQKGEIDLSGLSEIEQDKQGKQLALAWIHEHPATFAKLMLEKVVRFLGDDATGIYNTFKSGGASASQSLYFILKMGANAWWIAAWVLLAWLVAQALATRADPLGIASLPVWLWFYLLALHSVFESAGKYHVPALWALCVVLAIYTTAYIQREQS